MKYLRMMKLRLMLISIGLLMPLGCATKPPTIIAADREVKRIKAEKPFTTKHDGWFVPDATWIDIRKALGETLNAPSTSN